MYHNLLRIKFFQLFPDEALTEYKDMKNLSYSFVKMGRKSK